MQSTSRTRTTYSLVCERCQQGFRTQSGRQRFCSRSCSSLSIVRSTLADRFASKYEVNEAGCWIWTGARNSDGYGSFAVQRKARSAHVVSWELSGRPRTPGMELDHLCRVRECVNPNHLEQVTHRENVLRGSASDVVNGMRTQCKHGHPYPENLYVSPKGAAFCRECKRAHDRRSRSTNN